MCQVTLVIHAPDYSVKYGAKNFEAVLADGVGKGYAIYQKDISKLPPNSTVVLLRKDKTNDVQKDFLLSWFQQPRRLPKEYSDMTSTLRI